MLRTSLRWFIEICTFPHAFRFTVDATERVNGSESLLLLDLFRSVLVPRVRSLFFFSH